MSRQFHRKQIAAGLVGLISSCLVGLETSCFAQTNQLPALNQSRRPQLPERNFRSGATNLIRRQFTNSPAAMEALARVNAESERRRTAPPTLQPLPPPNPGFPFPPRRISNVTNREPHTNSPGGITAHYEQVLSDPNLHPNQRKAYEFLLNDTRQRAAEFQTNQQLWSNLQEAMKSGRVEDVAKAKSELADFLSAFSKRAHDKSYPPGTSLEVILADIKARVAASTNKTSK